MNRPHCEVVGCYREVCELSECLCEQHEREEVNDLWCDMPDGPESARRFLSRAEHHLSDRAAAVSGENCKARVTLRQARTASWVDEWGPPVKED